MNFIKLTIQALIQRRWDLYYWLFRHVLIINDSLLYEYELEEDIMTLELWNINRTSTEEILINHKEIKSKSFFVFHFYSSNEMKWSWKKIHLCSNHCDLIAIPSKRKMWNVLFIDWMLFTDDLRHLNVHHLNGCDCHMSKWPSEYV